MDTGGRCRGLNFFQCGVRFSVADIVQNRVRKKLGFLENVRDLTTQTL